MRCRACNVLLEDKDKPDFCNPCNVESLKARFPNQKVDDNEVQDLVKRLEEVKRLTTQHELFS